MDSRVIKFRAWDKEKKKMYHFDELWWCDEYQSASFKIKEKQEDYWGFDFDYEDLSELMQFTGLYDVNSKEIWEGDILNSVIGPTKNVLVSWSDEYASFSIQKNGWAFRHFFKEAVEPNQCEVIGNIYENGDLLENK